MASPRVEVEIAGKATGFAAEFKKISAQASEAGNKIKSAFSGIQGAAAALGVGLSVAGFTAFIKGAIDAADKLNDLQKVTGVSAVTLGGIGFAAQQAGTDLEGVAKAFGKLNLQIADAQAGNEKTVEVFRKLGVSVAELKNLKSDEIFAKLADTFATYEDDANKAAAANLLFGKTYQSILPLLDEGGDSLQRNIGYYERYSGVTDDLVKASDQFNDSLTKLNLLNRAFANHLAAALLPSLQSLVEYLVQGKEKSNAFKDAASSVVEPLKVLAKWGVTAAMGFGQLGDLIGAVAAALGAIARGEFGQVLSIYDDYFARANATVKRLDAIKAAIDSTSTSVASASADGSSGVGRGRRKAPNFGDAGGGAAKSQVDEFARALERVAKMAAEADLELSGMFSTQEITGAQKALAALTSSDEWKKFTAPQQAELTSRLQAIDAIQRETAEWKKKNEEHAKAIKLYEEEQAAQQKAVDAFTDRLGGYAEENDYLERSIALIGQDDVARQKLAATIEFESLKKQALLADDQAGLAILEQQFTKRIQLIDQASAATTRFGQVQQINSIFADAFADSLVAIVDGTKSIKDAFRDMERSIVQSISRIAAQNLADAIFGKGPSSPGGGGFDFGKIIQMFIGSFFGSGTASWGGSASTFGPGSGFGYGDYAVGTNYVPRDMFARIHKGEQIVPAKYNDNNPYKPAGNGSGPSSVNITQNVTVMPGANSQSARQAAGRLRDATIRAIKDR